MAESLRFADILSTASAIANYVGAESVTAAHMLDSLDVLQERKSMEDLAPVRSAFMAARQPAATVSPAVQDVVRRWFDEIGRDINATIAGPALDRLADDLRQAGGSG